MLYKYIRKLKKYIITKFENYLKGRNISIDSLEANSIQEGMRWTIGQTCKWLEDNLFDYPWYDGAPNFTIDDIINDFKKAMEK